MKHLFVCLVLNFSYWTLSAQEQSSSVTNISIVTTASGTATELSWTKAGGDVAYFIVERSSNGQSFKQCGLVFPSEDPNFTQYKFRDTFSLGSPQYTYRVGIVSLQKEVKYLPFKK